MRQVASTARLKQTSHCPSCSLTSRIPSASGSAASSETLRMWNASRCAVRCPMPGSLANSPISLFTGGANTRTDEGSGLTGRFQLHSVVVEDRRVAGLRQGLSRRDLGRAASFPVRVPPAHRSDEDAGRGVVRHAGGAAEVAALVEHSDVAAVSDPAAAGVLRVDHDLRARLRRVLALL